MLTNKEANKLFKPHLVTTMPVPYVTKVMRGKGKSKQKGGCHQRGGDFLGIEKAFKKIGNDIVHNPLRLAAAIGTGGISETFLTPAQLIGDKVGVKPSKVAGSLAPVVGLMRPDMGRALGYSATGLKMVGLGRHR
jgi:hypothetical protein